jgi:hypothetical protein
MARGSLLNRVQGSGFRVQGSGFRVNERANRKISNAECKILKEGIRSILMVLMDRAKRYHPSKFDIQNSAVLRFAFALYPEP